jgi:hypothetical protein
MGNELFVAGGGSEAVFVYSRTADGNLAPLRLIAGPATNLSGPISLAVDTVNNEIAVGCSGCANPGRITVYPLTANGNVAPLRTLTLAEGTSANDLAIDNVNNELIVATDLSVQTYARTASGNSPPLRALIGPSQAFALALDTVNNELAVMFSPIGELDVYSRTASGHPAPLRTMARDGTFFNGVDALAIDSVNNELVLGSSGSPYDIIAVFSRTAFGNAAPLRTLNAGARGLAVDTVNNEIVVTDSQSVIAYSRTASGDVTPLRTIAGPATGLLNVFAVRITTGVSGPSPAAIPNLDARGLIVFSLILAGLGVFVIRRTSL